MRTRHPQDREWPGWSLLRAFSLLFGGGCWQSKGDDHDENQEGYLEEISMRRSKGGSMLQILASGNFALSRES
jgi:hypothetical protein